MHDPALGAVSRRLLSIEGQVQQLRVDIVELDAHRSRTPTRPVSPESAAAPAPAVSLESAPATELPRQPEHQRRSGAAPPAPRSPVAAPGAFEALLSGRGLAAAGVLLMLIGCAYFLDLSFTRGWIPPAGRIALGLIVGSALLAASTRFLRGTYRIVAECSVCLGAGITYLSSWAAIAVFPSLDIPRAAAFAAMGVVAVALTLIANRWRSQPIALMGLAGAYLTPILLGGDASHRAALAVYLLIVTSGMLALARRRSFVAVEITAAVATLIYGVMFIPRPDAGWSNTAAAITATAFYLMFAAAFTTRPIHSGAVKAFALVPFVATTALFLILLECLLGSTPKLLGLSLLGVATALLAAANLVRGIPGELKPAYRCLALLAGNLALRSLLQRFELFDALSIEAAALTIFGARIVNPNIANIGVALFAIAGVGLLWNAATFAPAQTMLTPLILGFAIWLQAAFASRRAIPHNLRPGFWIGVHGVALAGLTRAALDATGGPDWNVALPNGAQLALSITWALFAAGLFGRGVTTRANVARWEGLTLFAITIVKVFTLDFASLDLAYRVLAFLGTGVVLFVSSAWYMRSLRATSQQSAT